MLLLHHIRDVKYCKLEYLFCLEDKNIMRLCCILNKNYIVFYVKNNLNSIYNIYCSGPLSRTGYL